MERLCKTLHVEGRRLVCWPRAGSHRQCYPSKRIRRKFTPPYYIIYTIKRRESRHQSLKFRTPCEWQQPGSHFGGDLLTVDSVSRSSMTTTIFCLTFTTTLQVSTPIPREFTICLSKFPLSYVPRYSHSVSGKGSPLQYPDDGLRGCHSSHSCLHPSSTEHRLGLVSPSSRGSQQLSSISAFAA